MNNIKDILDCCITSGKLQTSRIKKIKDAPLVSSIMKNVYPEYDGDLRYFLVMYENGLSDIPKCKTCGIKLAENRRSFLTYCSRKCRSMNEEWKMNHGNSLMKSYGVSTPFQSKTIQDRAKTTNLQRYGFENAMCDESLKLKAIKAKKDKYGDNYGHLQYGVYKKTCLEKYGVENTFQSNEKRQKLEQTNLLKYGQRYFHQTTEGRVNISNRRKNETLETKEKRRMSLVARSFLIKETAIKNINEKDFFKDYYESGYTCHEMCRKYNIKPFIYKYMFEKYDQKRQNRWRSTKEINLFDIFSTFGDIIVSNDRKTLSPYEIDIFFPDKKIGIEYHGSYWHSTFHKDKNFHREKYLLAKEKDVTLLQFFEYEFDEKHDVIISMIKSKLGKLDRKLNARDLVIREVSNVDSKEFLELNHLQGFTAANIRIGLYDNEELVSLMTFSKPRFNKAYDYELIRLCTKLGVNVRGGASKMFKHMVNMHRPKSIISYSDLRYSNGVVYKNLGFTYVTDTNPNYVYIRGDEKLSRYQAQKHKLRDLLGEDKFDETKTEQENMMNNHYLCIYDAGNQVWEYKA